MLEKIKYFFSKQSKKVAVKTYKKIDVPRKNIDYPLHVPLVISIASFKTRVAVAIRTDGRTEEVLRRKTSK